MGLVQYATDPELGDVPHNRTPVKIDGSIRVRTVAPELGQHAEIFGRMGLSEEKTRIQEDGRRPGINRTAMRYGQMRMFLLRRVKHSE